MKMSVFFIYFDYFFRQQRDSRFKFCRGCKYPGTMLEFFKF